MKVCMVCCMAPPGCQLSAASRPPPQGLGSKDVKLACKERAALLSLLYRCVELAVARGTCGLGPTLLGYAGWMGWGGALLPLRSGYAPTGRQGLAACLAKV
jgi:hypothetical protein